MSEKRTQLLNNALDLFYRHGIKSIGVNEVIKVSGVAKKTLYSHFDSKDKLILSVLEKRHQVFIAWLEAKIGDISSNNELIETLFYALGSWFDHKEPALGHFHGCFFINTSAEFHDPTSEIVQYCRFHKEQVRQLIQNKLIENSEALLNAICLLKEGAITTAYMTGESTAIIKQSIDILQRLERLPSRDCSI